MIVSTDFLCVIHQVMDTVRLPYALGLLAPPSRVRSQSSWEAAPQPGMVGVLGPVAA